MRKYVLAYRFLVSPSHRHIHRSGSGNVNPASNTSSSSGDSWLDFLAPSHPGKNKRSKTPSTLQHSPSTVLQCSQRCLQEELPRVYSVHRPFEHPQKKSDRQMCTPNDYLTLIDSLLLHYRRQANLDLHHHQNEATPCFQQTYFYFVKKVILLLFDLLQKPIHPQHGACNAWDLSAEEIIHTKADVIKKLWLASFGKSHKRQQEEANWNDESGADVLHFVLFDVLHLHRRHEITTTDHHKAELYLSVLYELVMERLVLLESGKGKIQRSKLIYTFEKEHDHLPQHCSAPAREWESERMVLHPLFFTGLLSVCLQIPSHTGDGRGFKQNVILLLQQAAQCCLYPLLPVSETANVQDTSPPKDGESLFTEGIIFEAAETAALCGDAETVTRLLFLLYQSRGLLYSSSVLLAEREETPRGRGWLYGYLFPSSTRSAEHQQRHPSYYYFENSVIRLVKTVIYAILQNETHRRHNANVRDAVQLFHHLSSGTTWECTAAMGLEILTYICNEMMNGQQTNQELPSIAIEVYNCIYKKYKKQFCGSNEHNQNRFIDVLAVCAERVCKIVSTNQNSTNKNSFDNNCVLVELFNGLNRVLRHEKGNSQHNANYYFYYYFKNILPYALRSLCQIMLTDGKPQSGNCVLWTSLQKSHSVYANNENHHHYTTLLTVHALYLYSTTHEMKDGKDFLAVLYNHPNNHNTNTNEETDNVAGDGQTIALYWLLGFVLHAYRKAHLHDLQLLLNDGALPHSVGLEYNVVHTLMDLGGGLERWKTLFLEWNRDKEEIRNLFYENLIALLQDSPANGFCVSSLSVVYDMVQTTLLTDPNKKMNQREVTNLLQLFYANGHHTLLSGHPSPNVVLDALCAQYGGSCRSTALDPFLSDLYRHCNGQETSTAGRQTAVVYLTKETLQTLTAEPFPVEKTSSSLLEGWLESVLHPLLHRPSSHPAGGETFYYVLFSLDAVLYTVDHGDNPLLKEIQSSLHSPDHPGMNSRVKSFFLCPLPSVNPSSGTRKEWNDLYFLYRKVKSDKKINLSAHYPKWFLWHEAESVSPCADPNNNNNIEWITMKRAKRLQAKKSILSLLQHHHLPHPKLSSEHYKYAMKQDTNNNNNTNSNRSNQKERSTAH